MVLWGKGRELRRTNQEAGKPMDEEREMGLHNRSPCAVS